MSGCRECAALRNSLAELEERLEVLADQLRVVVDTLPEASQEKVIRAWLNAALDRAKGGTA